MSNYKATKFALAFGCIGFLGGASIPMILLFLVAIYLFGILS
jgi:hypothetical protein